MPRHAGLGPRRRSVLAVAALGLMTMVAPVSALVILPGAGGDPAAADSPAFAAAMQHVEPAGSGTAVYLGGGFVLRTSHTGGPAVGRRMFGQTVTWEQRLHQPGRPDQPADLVLVGLDAPASLDGLSLATSTSPGDTVRLIGMGGEPADTMTHWRVDNGAWTETTDPAHAQHSGYRAGAAAGHPGPGARRWGANRITAGPIEIDLDHAGSVTALYTTFDRGPLAIEREAQAVGHDSGGAVLALDEQHDRWMLVGLIHAVGAFEGQPDLPNTAVFGNVTYFSDLSAYHQQIAQLAMAPEPAALATLMLTLPAVLRRRRR